MTLTLKKLFSLVLAVALIPVLWACNPKQPDKPTPPDPVTPPQPVPEETYDAAFAIGEFPYLKIGDLKGADAFEKKLGKRAPQTIKKVGEVYLGTTPTYFKGTKYSEKVSAALLEMPIIKVDATFVGMMEQAGFKDYGVSMIQDAQGNLSPCRIFWSQKLKVEADMYDVKLSALKNIKSVIEFVPKEDEPVQHNDQPDPNPSVILADAKDFPLVDLLGSPQAELPKDQLIAAENKLGFRVLDEDATNEETVYFSTLEAKANLTNLKAVIYFYDTVDKMITQIVLDCKAVTTPEDLARPELKAWFQANGYAFETKHDTAKGPGLKFRNPTMGVKAYIYLKNSNNACFIELTK